MKIARDVNVVGQYDVVVCGGGPAGWVAAVASARQGAHTALVERLGFVGGTATACLTVPVSGFFKNGARVVGGIPWEFIQKMVSWDAALLEMPKGHVSVDTEVYKLFAQRMLRDTGVDLYLNAALTDAVREGSRITAVACECRGRSFALAGKCFVDATGMAELCVKADVPTFMPQVSQPVSLCFELCGVELGTPLLRDYIHHDGQRVKNSCQQDIHAYLETLFNQGRGPQFGGPWFNTMLRGDHVAVNVTRHAAPGDDLRDIAEVECQLREDMFAIHNLLKERYPEFRYSVIAASGLYAGVRDGRRLAGMHRLTGEELAAAVHFDDAIARNAHPMDIHIAGAGKQTLIEVTQAGYIPYRSLVSSECDNLMVAGRSISADDHAHASIRVQGTAMAIGQAAGAAASLAAVSPCAVGELDTGKLRQLLMQTECIL